MDEDNSGMADGWSVSTSSGSVGAATRDVIGPDSTTGSTASKWDDYQTFTGKYQEIVASTSVTDANLIVNVTRTHAVVAGVAYVLSFHYMTNCTQLQLVAGNMALTEGTGVRSSGNPQLWKSTALTVSQSKGVHGVGVSLDDAAAADSPLMLDSIAYYHTTFRALSSGSFQIQMKTTLGTSGVNGAVVLRLDNFRLTPLYSGVGSRATWQTASNRCEQRGLRLCSRQDYCPNGPGTSPFGGSFLTKQLTGTKAGIERWAPYQNVDDATKYHWIKLEAVASEHNEYMQTCNDQPPPGRYTCPEYFARGNCTASWMTRHCCQSCFRYGNNFLLLLCCSIFCE